MLNPKRVYCSVLKNYDNFTIHFTSSVAALLGPCVCAHMHTHTYTHTHTYKHKHAHTRIDTVSITETRTFVVQESKVAKCKRENLV